MIHLKNSGYLPQDAPLLLTKADQLASRIGVIVRDMRVSSRYLEFDISVKKEELGRVIDMLASIGPLDDARHIVEEKIDKEEAIEKARQYFNYERYWECHEVLEGVWKKTYEGEKDLIQGIILVAAALVHYQKNEVDICISIMRRAIEKLSNSSGKYHDIDIDKFRNNVSDIISTRKIEKLMI